MSNAGYGPLPETVSECFADATIGSAGNITNSGDGDYSFWHSHSAIGFYAYDCSGPAE